MFFVLSSYLLFRLVWCIIKIKKLSEEDMENMIISCIGDSLTEGDMGIWGTRGKANMTERNYPYFLAEMTGASVRNLGKCGFRASSYLKYYKEGKADIVGSDIVIVMLGTNGGLDLESPDGKENASYRELITLIKRDAPDAKLYLCTPPHVTEDPIYSNCGHKEQIEKAVLFVRELAEKEKIALIDTALCPELTAENEHIMQPNDGLHFSEAGYLALAGFIADKIGYAR